MAMRWHETPSKLVAHGTVKHSVWQAFAASGFYAKSGMDMHGPYETASRARKACADIEEAEAADHIDAQAATINALVEALNEIVGSASPDHWVPQYVHCVAVASAALAAAKDADR